MAVLPLRTVMAQPLRSTPLPPITQLDVPFVEEPSPRKTIPPNAALKRPVKLPA